MYFRLFLSLRDIAYISLVLFTLLSFEQTLGLESVTVKCGTSSDITNVGAGNELPASMGGINLSNLDNKCYGKTKETLLLLQEAIKEGEKCYNSASAIQDRLEQMCAYLKPMHGFSKKFERVLWLLKKIHGALDNGTKFANNIPAVGKLRQILVEKVMPVVLDTMETVNKGIRKIVDYMEEFLEYKNKKKEFKLLWEIDKKGTTICKLLSPVGSSLQLMKSTIKKIHNPSKVVLQAVNEGQTCMTSYCSERGGSSSCSECSLVDKGFARAIPKIMTWKRHMNTCNEELGKANALMKKLSVIGIIFRAGDAIMNKIEKFLKPVADKLEKFAKSLGPVMKNLMSCCPCGRPNPVGCAVQTVKNVVDLVTCPLDGLTNHLINNLLSSLKTQVGLFLKSLLPKINIKISLPEAGFEIDVPKYLQACFASTRFHKAFTKLCILPSKSLTLTFGASFKTGKSLEFANRSSSFNNEIQKSCSKALGAFTKFGKEMSTCFDSVDDAFFAIPPVGAIAALTCDPNYHDPDPGINYCPCKRDDDVLTQKQQKQPYCVIWHRSAFKTCSSLCAEKKYSSGRNPDGGSGKMYKTHGYPYCERLEYYCRAINAKVKNGRVVCSNEYIFLGGTCKVIPDPGYICPVTFIECGSVTATKGVCWNYRFIECAKDDNKHFPMCTCRNSHAFKKGELVCQAGKTTADTLAALKEMRKSFSCFKPLGLEKDIQKDCGHQMHPCVVQQPNVEAYHRCNLKRVEKFWDAHGGKFAIAGGVFMALAVIAMVGIIISAPNVPAIVCCVLVLIVGIVFLACGLAIKTAGDDDENYLKMGDVLL